MLFVKTLLICCFLILYEVDAYEETAKRQCSCAEQTECFVAIKDETAKCFDGAYGPVYDELKKFGDPNKMKPCFDKFTNFVKKWILCVNENLIKDKSCLPQKKDVKIPSKDFLTIYVNELRENVDKRMNYLFGLSKHPLVKLDEKWHNFAKVCTVDKVLKLSCFNNANCIPKGAETEIQKAITNCYKELNVVEVQQTRCKCMKDNCASDGLNGFCEKLEHITLPEL